jgi:ornithine--oxo-acid transaminase
MASRPRPAPLDAPPVLDAAARAAIEAADRHHAAVFKPLPLVVRRAEGCWLEDTAGRRYLDLLGGLSTMAQGHAHPRVVAALTEQAGRVTHVSRAVYTEPLGRLCALLAEVTGFPRALLMNSGAEANETAVKLARRWAYAQRGVPPDRARVVAAQGNFHGRTLAMVSASSNALYRDGFGPFDGGFDLVPYGDPAAVAAAIGPHTAAVLLEPIQGENGVVIPPAGYLAAVRRLCTERRVLCIWDEVQTGFGRTGRWFAWQHEDARPDVLVLGKALGAGLAVVSAVCADDALWAVLPSGSHGSTFGGNPLACAVGVAAIEVLRDEGLVARSAELGAYFVERLRALASPRVAEVRGRGLFAALELRPEAGPARAMAERLLARGVLTKDLRGSVLRLAPALTITREELDWGVARIGEALRG